MSGVANLFQTSELHLKFKFGDQHLGEFVRILKKNCLMRKKMSSLFNIHLL